MRRRPVDLAPFHVSLEHAIDHKLPAVPVAVPELRALLEEHEVLQAMFADVRAAAQPAGAV